MRYHDMSIEADQVRGLTLSDGRRLVQFRVRVIESPGGEMRPEEAIEVEYIEEELQLAAQKLAARTLDPAGLLTLGKTLGMLLLPPPAELGQPGVHPILVQSLQAIPAEDGLRIRLRLPAELAALPWEYLVLERNGSDTTLGFLLLDPRVALVRHEPLPAADPAPHAGGPLRLVAALASPAGMALLDLSAERRAIEQACAGQAGIDLAVLDQATQEQLHQALAGAEIFHFAGHGLAQGGGAIALADGRFDAEPLGAALRSSGVRLALLGGCDTGQRDGLSTWGGTAPTLVRSEIPAVIAYQFSIRDTAAIAFAGAFYRALVGGLPIERATAAGRIAAHALEPDGREWGAAVLYMRAEDGQLFAGSEDPQVREQAAKVVNASLQIRANQVAGATYVVMEVGKIKADRVTLNLSVDATQLGVNSTITGVRIDEL